ncbi:MAG: diacylglycerol kinase [Tissierellia bacterium]|nr:diacylglycerol kinase [Tissierellia bacterium]
MTEVNKKDNDDKEEKDFDPKEGRTAAERFVKGFDYAFDGIVFSIKNEKNMKFHAIASLVVLLFSLFMNISRIEMILVILATSFVFVSELINTAIEQTVNLASKGKYSEFAKAAKDVSAGATLVAAVGALFVAYLVFFDKVINLSNSVLLKIQRAPSHLALITLAFVVIFTVLLKGLFYRGHGTAFHGGAVSGHTAISFSLATIGAIMARDVNLAIIFFLIALIVAESRFEANIHSIKEIIAGGILGIVLAFLIFGGFTWLM